MIADSRLARHNLEGRGTMGPTEVGGKVERISLPPSSIRILPLACKSEYLIKYLFI